MGLNFENRNAQIKKTLFLSYPFFLLLIFTLVVIPSFHPLTRIIPYDEKRIFELAIYCIAITGILFSRPFADAFLKYYLSLHFLARGILFIVLILGLTSSSLPQFPYDALLEVGLFILLFCYSISLGALTKQYQTTILLIVISTLLISIFFYATTFFSGYIGSFIQSFAFDTRILFANFSNVRFFNQFQIWLIPLIILPVLIYREKLNPRLFAFILLLNIAWWTILFASQGRGIKFAILGASLLSLLIFRKHSWPFLKWLSICAALGFVSYLLLFVYLPDGGQEIILHGVLEDSPRIHLWSSAVHMILDNPMLGVGPQHYAYYQQTIANHPHNALLQIAAEWGIPVAILVVLLVVWGAIAWCRRFYDPEADIISSEKKHIWIALFCSLSAGLAYSMVSGVIVMPLSQLMMATVIGLMLGMYQSTQVNSVRVTKGQVTILRLILLVPLIYVPVKMAPDIITRYEMPGPPYNPNHVGPYQPRFWLEGDIYP